MPVDVFRRLHGIGKDVVEITSLAAATMVWEFIAVGGRSREAR
jgi:hypothetical protein